MRISSQNTATVIRRMGFFALCATLSAICAGCQLGTAMNIQQEQAPTPQVTQSDRDLLDDVPNASSYLHNGFVPPKIKQAASAGPGIMICGPVTAPSDSALGAFGDACAAWLQIAVGGQPQLGRTPSWSSVRRSALELNQPGLRLTTAQAAALNQTAGATCAAVGTLTDKGSGQYELVYRLVALPAAVPLASQARIDGTREQIMQQLPQLAKQMALQLGVADPKLPQSPQCTPDDMAFLGERRWNDNPTDADRLRLTTLAEHPGNGLAAIINLYWQRLYSPREKTAAVDLIAKELPDNPIADAEIAAEYPDSMATVRTALLADAARFPHNYQFALARTKMFRAQNAAPQIQIASAVATLDSNTKNPDAWTMTGTTFRKMADKIRQGRTVNNISEEEWSRINKFYPYWLGCHERAAKLDQHDGYAWGEVAGAAAFAGYGDEADAAERRALNLGQDLSNVYWWGLQMYQPKWYDSPQKITAIAKIASTDKRLTPDDLIYVATSIDRKTYPTEHGMLVNAAIASLQSQIASTPNDPQLHKSLGDALEAVKRGTEAQKEYEAAVRLAPNNPNLHYALAHLIYDLGEYAEALQQFQAVAALEPEYPDVHYRIGYALKEQGQYAKAAEEIQKEIKIYPNSPDAYFGLGAVYMLQNRHDIAGAAFVKSAHLDPWRPQVWEFGAIELDRSKQYAASIKTIEEGLNYFREDGSMMNTLQDDYLNLKQPAKTLEYCQEALMFDKNPSSIAVTHENNAEAYLQQNKLDAARREWNVVVQMNDQRTSPVAANFLAKYPAKPKLPQPPT